MAISDPPPPSRATVFRRRLACAVLWAVVLAAAYVVPRAAVMHGIEAVFPFRFGDMPSHLLNRDLLAKRISLPDEARQDPYFLKFPNMFRAPFKWPEGVYLVSLPWYLLFGPLSIWSVHLTNAMFALVLVLGVLGLARTWGMPRAGPWAALLTLLCPPLFSNSLYYSLDFPLVGMTVVGLLLLVKSRNFDDLRHSLAFGVWSALGLSVKQAYPLYLLLPAAWSFGVAMWRGPRRGRAAIHAVLATAVTLGLCALLAGWDLMSYLKLVGVQASDANLQATWFPSTTLRGALAYGAFMLMDLPWPLLVAAAPGLWALHRHRSFPGRAMLLTSWWGSLVLLTFMLSKLPRYLYPLYPLLCLVLVMWTCSHLPRQLAWISHQLRREAKKSAVDSRCSDRSPPVRVGLAALFAAVLALSVVYPAPWAPGPLLRWYAPPAPPGAPPADVRIRDLFETPVPDPAELERIRRNVFHNECKIAPMLEAAAKLVQRAAPRTSVVAVGVFSSVDDRPFLMEQNSVAAMWMSGYLPDRWVIGFRNWGQMHDLPPAVLAFHASDQDWPAASPGLMRTAGRSMTVECIGDGFPVHISLLVPDPNNPPELDD